MEDTLLNKCMCQCTRIPSDKCINDCPYVDVGELERYLGYELHDKTIEDYYNMIRDKELK